MKSAILFTYTWLPIEVQNLRIAFSSNEFDIFEAIFDTLRRCCQNRNLAQTFFYGVRWVWDVLIPSVDRIEKFFPQKGKTFYANPLFSEPTSPSDSVTHWPISQTLQMYL